MAEKAENRMGGFAGAKFGKVAETLRKDVDREAGEAKRHLSQMQKLKIKVRGSSKHDLKWQLDQTKKAGKLFESELIAVRNKKAETPDKLEAAYDALSLHYAGLSHVNDKWAAVFATDFLVKGIAWLHMVEIMHKVWVKTLNYAEKDIKHLEKLLKQAEKERWKQYAKNGISTTWTVLSWTVGPLKLISKAKMVAGGAATMLATDAILGSPEDVTKDAGKATLDVARIRAAANEFGKTSKALWAASAVVGAVLTLDNIDQIDDARAKVAALQAQMQKTALTLKKLEERVRKGAGDVYRSHVKIMDLAKRAESQMQKARDADSIYKDLLRQMKQAT